MVISECPNDRRGQATTNRSGEFEPTTMNVTLNGSSDLGSGHDLRCSPVSLFLPCSIHATDDMMLYYELSRTSRTVETLNV